MNRGMLLRWLWAIVFFLLMSLNFPPDRTDRPAMSAAVLSIEELRGLTYPEKILLDARAELREHLPSGWPITGDTHVITSPFGFRVSPVARRAIFHAGIDLKSGWLAPVHSTAAGRVEFSGWKNGYGRTVILDHGYYHTLYAHLARRKVRTGHYVNKGDVIGLTGASGRVTGPHLHYEVRCKTRQVDPVLFL